MKYPLSWLQDYVPITIPTQELANKLSMAGFEVDEILSVGDILTGIVTVKIESIEKHPDADKLVITQVNDGTTTHQIVTGANNISVGDIVPASLPGAVLANGTKIKASKLRGIPSNGMLCSETELGIAEESAGIWILDPTTPIGVDFVEYAALKDEILDVSILPNRGDGLSIIGLAHEISVLLDQPLTIPNPTPEPSAPCTTPLTVAITAPDQCERYQARQLNNVTIAPSPLLIQRRLQLCDIRPINNVVDITNYVLLEMGQPLHAFDRTHITTNTITVSLATDNTTITTLDGEERQLKDTDLVICDDTTPIALAGVMGNADSQVTDTTTDIVLESATFHPTTVRRTANRLALRTDSAVRFEKGLDPTLASTAANRAIELLIKHANATYLDGIASTETTPITTQTVAFNPDKINAILGTNFAHDDILHTLLKLGFTQSGDTLTVPTWRTHDIVGTPDLAEELIRLKGLDHIPSTPLTLRAPIDAPTPIESYRTILSALFIAQGYHDVVTMPMIAPHECDLIGHNGNRITLKNPLSQDESVMRPHGLPGLLKVAQFNANRQCDTLKISEITKCFDGTAETVMAQALAFGPELTFEQINGLARTACTQLGLKQLTAKRADTAFFHPGQSAELYSDDTKIGEVGLMHPKLRNTYDLPKTGYLALNLTTIATLSATKKQYTDYSVYPFIKRDIAILAPKTLSFHELTTALENAKIKFLVDVQLFDQFESDEKLGKDNKSIGISCIYQSPKKTLQDDTITRLHDQAIKALTQHLPVQIR